MWQSKAQEQIFRAMEADDAKTVADLSSLHPEAVSPNLPGNLKTGWVAYALAWDCKIQTIIALLDAGFDVNAIKTETQGTALMQAMKRNDAETIVKLLLSRGADPNLGQTAFAALLGCKDKTIRLRILQMLLDHGLDLNRLSTVFGDENKLFTVLDRATDPQDINFFLQHGAKYAVQLAPDRAAFPIHKQA